MTRKKSSAGGLVYSTNKDLMKAEPEEAQEEIAPEKQQLRIRLDSKQRGGKVVTLIEGYEGAGLDDLGKKLKNYCGTGGSAKDNQVIIQGDNREKVLQWLQKNGYSRARKI